MAAVLDAAALKPQFVGMTHENLLDRRFFVAPMMDWTDRHCWMFHCALSKRALLWTEMVTADAVIHGDREQLIGYSDAEHPVVLQLGGSDPDKLAEAARIAEGFGYDEVNINTEHKTPLRITSRGVLFLAGFGDLRVLKQCDCSSCLPFHSGTATPPA